MLNPVILGFIIIVGLPLQAEITDIYPPIFDYIWAAGWGILFGSAYQQVYDEHEKRKLKEFIENNKK